MRSIFLFVEDFAHETFLRTITQRLADEYSVSVSFTPSSVRGGHGRVLAELGEFVRDFDQGRRNLPDLLVVATDANCKGYTERKEEIDSILKEIKNLSICAIPDPHIERWLLIDSAAFKAVFGRGCNAPDQKCGRARYKQLLSSAIREAGISAPLGGVEFADDIVKEMDLRPSRGFDASLGKLIDALKAKFAEWANAQPGQCE
jgi:hypothetical protein